MTDTIFALSSGRGKAGVAVVRVSGSDLQKLFSDIVKPLGAMSPPFEGRVARHAYLAELVDSKGNLIDKAIAIYFPAPNSFTGEDVIEFHTHGSAAVLEKLFETLRGLGVRMAAPGEFARRAFHNNKMDLIEADGLCALLDARTDRQRRQALKSMTGGDSEKLENWRSQMIEISAFAAAILDYDENDLPKNIKENLVRRTQKLHSEIASAISRSGAVRAIHHGFNIALVGDVNVGKSSLFNRLVGESRAIVSDIPGTTRDVVSAEIDMDGYLVRLSDTAGLRETDDKIEKIGIEKTNAEIENADLVIRVVSHQSSVVSRENANEIQVLNKCDLDGNRMPNTVPAFAGMTNNRIPVSAQTGEGIGELLDMIKQRVHKMLDGAESDIAINERTRMHLTAALKELAVSNQQLASMDLFAEHIRRAADEIGQILGVIGASEIADAVFGQLCLGK